ncbi:MAG: hypothetical protein HFJ28_03015 [Clostridia bacterium]|nr:hypothetical protein [Clostridia bacterium]
MGDEKFIKEVEELLKQIREEQIKVGKNIEKYHKINMKKFAKLREYNEICDMTNQVFERRISNIENILKKAIK